MIDVYVDANWAGCRRTRKSTSVGCAMLGKHCIKAWSKTQSIIAKSSGESELYGVIKGSSEALGLLTLAGDLGMELKTRVHVDATAAKGMVERRGISRVRHIEVDHLWIQEQEAYLASCPLAPPTARPAMRQLPPPAASSSSTSL